MVPTSSCKIDQFHLRMNTFWIGVKSNITAGVLWDSQRSHLTVENIKEQDITSSTAVQWHLTQKEKCELWASIRMSVDDRSIHKMSETTWLSVRQTPAVLTPTCSVTTYVTITGETCKDDERYVLRSKRTHMKVLLSKQLDWLCSLACGVITRHSWVFVWTSCKYIMTQWPAVASLFFFITSGLQTRSTVSWDECK